MPTGETSPFLSLVLSIPGHQAKSTLCAFVWKQLGGEELFVWYYRKLSWCACGGARLSGNELEFRLTAFCFRWERICLITCGSSILAMTLTALPHALQSDISISPEASTFGEYSFQASPQGAYFWCAFMPSGAAHGGMLLHRRSLIAVYLAFGALASFRRRHQGSVFAIGCEHAMEACQIGSRPGYQSCQARHEIQWLEDNVGSAVSVRCLQLVADVAD